MLQKMPSSSKKKFANELSTASKNYKHKVLNEKLKQISNQIDQAKTGKIIGQSAINIRVSEDHDLTENLSTKSYKREPIQFNIKNNKTQSRNTFYIN